MKKIIICLVLLINADNSFCQQSTSSEPYTSKYYLEKSKNQRGGARALLIVGGVFIGTSIIILAPGKTSFDNIAGNLAIGGVGVASALCSIPLFIASARNKRKGMAATTNIKLERNLSVYNKGDIVSHAYPAVSIKINL